MKNNDIRAEIARAGLFYYQVAAAMNVKPNTLAHYLRAELTKPQKQRIKDAIARAKKEV